jgi:hypothetical protein
MKRLLFSPTIIIFIVMLHCCKNNAKRISVINDEFPQKLQLYAEKIKINEVLKPMELISIEDFIVIQNEYLPSEKCFYIYDKNTYQFCFSFGQLGQSGANDEFVAPRLVHNCKENILQIFDQATRLMYSYTISKKEAILLKQERINDGDRLPLQKISNVNDSILIFLTSQRELCCYNLSRGMIVDKFNFKTTIKNEVEHYNPALEGFSFSNSNTNIFVCFNFMNILQKGVLDDRFHFDFNAHEISSSEIFHKNMYDNTFYYSFVNISDKYIFAGNFGYSFLSLQPFPVNTGKRYFEPHIEIYDLDMNKIALLELDNNLFHCDVDEKQKIIYTWNPLEDFDHLLVYKYDF